MISAMGRSRSAVLILASLTAAAVSAQTSTRVATTVDALRSAPVFFHGKPVAALGSVVEQRGLVRFVAAAEGSNPPAADPGAADRPIYVYWRQQPSLSSGELRGEFWDLGRLTEGDSRFTAYDFKPLLEAATQGRWPGRDQIFVVIGATMVESTLPNSPTLRAVVLAPERYENRSVSVSGRFRGRNLHADIAAPIPTPTKWDFVVQSADASIWITGLQPKGSKFDLDANARRDTGRWLQIGGMVRRQGPRVWIEAREIALSSGSEDTTTDVEVPATPPEPPPSVVFSAPVPDENDVELQPIVRIQFSRDMDARSFKDRVRVSYVPRAGAAQGPPAAPPTMSVAYNVGNRGLELKFGKPLERFQTVRVELLDGIKAIDGTPLPPWTLTFTTGR
jgi:hypothetical protein